MSALRRGQWPQCVLPESLGDRLLEGAHLAKVELLLIRSDDGPGECTIDVELRSLIDGPDAGNVLAALVEHFQTPRTEGGAK